MENNKISKLICKYNHLLVKLRQDLHCIPEIGENEKKTSKYIGNILHSTGISFNKGIAGYGIVATIKTGRKGPTLMFRADMDALPILETTGLSFTSQHKGIMHSCGHDGHMAMVLTTAIVLNKLRDQIKASCIKFVFQPAEEGPGGALKMIRADVMKYPQVDYVFGCHIWPLIKEGYIGIKSGILMAGEATFKIKIEGSGGHAAMPHLCTDPIHTGCQIVKSLKRIVSRYTNPFLPIVLTVTKFKAGNTNNIIPKTAILAGTVRAFSSDVLNSLNQQISNIVSRICKGTGIKYKTEFTLGYPPTINDYEATQIVKKAAEKSIETKKILDIEKTMGSEDISYFLQKAKGCYFFLGSGNNDITTHLHTPTFNFDEKILSTGVEIFCRIAVADF